MKRALFSALVLGLACAACGDDGGDGDKGGGDEGPNLEDAFDIKGVRADMLRAEQVIPVACETIVECGFGSEEFSSASDCTSQLRTGYTEYVAKKVPDSCLDAILDLYSCESKNDDCGEDACNTEFNTRTTKCKGFVVDEGI